MVTFGTSDIDYNLQSNTQSKQRVFIHIQQKKLAFIEIQQKKLADGYRIISKSILEHVTY